MIATHKPRWKSRTHRFNVIMAGLSAAEANLHILKPLLPVDSFIVISFVLIVGNFIFREMTNTGIATREMIDRVQQ